MQFVRTAYDGEGMTEKRLEVRPPYISVFATSRKAVNLYMNSVFHTVGKPLASIYNQFSNRLDTLHLVGVERLKEHHVVAGGQLDGEGRLKGSVLIVESNKREDVDDYLAKEIYAKEHVWEKITVERMNVVQAHGEKVGS